MEQPKGERKETILDLVWVDDFRRCLRHPRTMIPRKSLVYFVSLWTAMLPRRRPWKIFHMP
jgi:hypothetical protein